jgi:phage recombination protein Bet
MTNLAVYTSQWDDSQVKLIKQQIAPGCSDDELALFGMVCKQTQLDPFLRQIYAIPRSQWNATTKTTEMKMTIQISIDGYRIMAARTNRHLCTAISWCGQDGHWVDIWLSEVPPAAAKAEIWVKGCDRPFVAVAKFNSYKQTNRDGKLTGNWEKMPELMIGNAAERLGIRMAFPGVFATAPDANHQPSVEAMEAVDITSEPTAELVEAEYAETGAEEIAAFKAQVQKLFKLCKISGGDRTQWAIDLHGVASPTWTRDQWEIGVADLKSRLDLVDSFEQSQAA